MVNIHRVPWMCCPKKKKKKKHVICLTSYLFFHHISKRSGWYPNCFDPLSFSERLTNEKLKFCRWENITQRLKLYDLTMATQQIRGRAGGFNYFLASEKLKSFYFVILRSWFSTLYNTACCLVFFIRTAPPHTQKYR